jgi:hypothetical protein
MSGSGGGIRHLELSQSGRTLTAAHSSGAESRTRGNWCAKRRACGRGWRLGRRVSYLRELGQETVVALAPEEQHLVATGRPYFQDLSFDHLRRMQFDLEMTGLHPERDRIFMVAVRYPSGATETLEAACYGNAGEAALQFPPAHFHREPQMPAVARCRHRMRPGSSPSARAAAARRPSKAMPRCASRPGYCAVARKVLPSIPHLQV